MTSLTSDEDALLSTAKAYEEAWLRADVATLDDLLNPEFVYTSPQGQVFTKDQDLDNLRTGRLKYRSLTVDDCTARVFGDTGVVLTRTSVSGDVSGAPFNGRFRGTGTWVKRDGKWRIVAFHASAIAT